MKEKISRTEAKEKIEKFFGRGELNPEDVKKIKKLAMRFNVKLGEHKKRFCKKCLSDLKDGKVSVGKTMKTVECRRCGYLNRWKFS